MLFSGMRKVLYIAEENEIQTRVLGQRNRIQHRCQEAHFVLQPTIQVAIVAEAKS